MTIASVRADHYRVPLPVALSNSTHGTMSAFELVTVRLRDGDGAEGLGYTYTVGAGGGAVHSLIARDLAPLLEGADETRIEALWQKLWWRSHYVGRGGLAVHAISAIDTALWDLLARRRGLPLWRLLGGHDPQVPAYAGGIDLQFPLEQLLAQTEDNLAKGFRAIKMKVGRERLSRGHGAGRGDARAARPGRAADGRRQHALARRRGDPGGARLRRARGLLARGADDPGRRRGPRPDPARGRAADRRRREPPQLYEFQALIAAGGVSFPEPDLSNCGGVSVWLKVARLAEAANLPVTSHGVHDLHVHLLAAVPNASYLEVHGFGLERFIAEPLRIEDGKAIAPERPGHGVELDWPGLEALRAD